MQQFLHFLIRLFWSGVAALIGLFVGFLVWGLLMGFFGYPPLEVRDNTPTSILRMEQSQRILRMNEWQGFLEYGAMSLIPLVFAGLFGYITLRSKHWSRKKTVKVSDPPGTIYYE
jgi:hypothetical protein